jgi:N-methylhydantoinase A
MAPNVYVTCGHELIAKPGEYERMTAVAINCFLGPLMSRYIRRIESRSAELGYRRPLLIMQSAGGVTTASEVAQKPIFTIGSGPAGGLTGTKFLADILGHPNVIASDVGGTSFDVGLISEGVPLSATESTVNQYTFSAPHLDVTSIGSGGGSIVWVDPVSRTLKVGPESAGADPGPACYGRGGTRPTVTDADTLLGFLDPERFLGGRLRLDRDASEAALRSAGEAIGLSPIETASAAVEIVEFQMAELMRQMTVQRGLDPRDFVVYSYGGAAGTRAVTYARELGCRTVVVPLGSTASTWSALGVQSADVLHVYEQAELFVAPFDAARINHILAGLEARGREQLLQDGIAKNEIRLDRSAEMKFRLQIHRVEVPLDSGSFDERKCRRLETTFIEKYERLYGRGSAFTGAGIEIGLLRVVARGHIRRPPIPKIPRGRRSRHVATRPVWWRELGRWRKTPIYEYARLGAGSRIAGPAIVLMPETTVVVRPGSTGRVDAYGNLILNLEK